MKIERVVEEKISYFPAGDYPTLTKDGQSTQHFEARDIYRVEYMIEEEVGAGAEIKIDVPFAHLFRCGGLYAEACEGGSFYVTMFKVGPNNFCDRLGAVPLPTFTKQSLGSGFIWGTIAAGGMIEVKIHNEAASPGIVRFRLVGRECREVKA